MHTTGPYRSWSNAQTLPDTALAAQIRMRGRRRRIRTDSVSRRRSTDPVTAPGATPGAQGSTATLSTGTTLQVMGPGRSSARKNRQNTMPISWPSVSSQLGTPGSRWATTTR